MKDVHLLVWITQLGLTVAAPLAGFTLVGVWIQNHFQTGKWVIVLFCVVIAAFLIFFFNRKKWM